MAWFANHYVCARCGWFWTDEWSCTCDDDCPECGARHMSPVESDDLTLVIRKRGAMFVVWRSTPSAEDGPDYREVIEFPTYDRALRFVGVTVEEGFDPLHRE